MQLYNELPSSRKKLVLRNLKIERKEKERIKEERSKAGKSFAHFIMAYCWIEDKETGSAIPFKLWESQKKLLPKFLHSMRLMVLKARQLGLTWLTAAYCLWLCTYKPLQLIVVISAKEEWAIEFLERVKFIYQRLPEWMKPKVAKDTTLMMEFAHKGAKKGETLNSVIKSLATTEEGAQSKTPTLLVLDETSRNRYARQIYASSKPGIDAAGGRIICISNAIKTGVGWAWTRNIYTGAMAKQNDFKRIFMPWWDRPDRPKDFIAKQISEGMEPQDVSEHYPETEVEAISAYGGSYFGTTLERHSMTKPGARYNIQKDEDGKPELIEAKFGVLEIWKLPYQMQPSWDGIGWNKRYAIGSDIAEGVGQTYSVGYVKDRLTEEYIVRMRSNRVDSDDWADMLVMMSELYNSNGKRTCICPEKTGAGQSATKKLVKLRANLYLKMQFDKQGKQLTPKYGWNQTETNKHELCSDLRAYFKNTDGRVYDSMLIDECSTFVQLEGSSQIKPEAGKFGDCVIAAGCTEQADMFQGGLPTKTTERELAKIKATGIDEKKEEELKGMTGINRAAWIELEHIKREQREDSIYEIYGE